MSEENRTGASGSFVICDVQREYAEHLMHVLSEYFSGSYQFHLFYDGEKLRGFTENSRVDVLLAAEEYGEEFLESISAGKKLILTGNPDGRLRGSTYIFRYQPAGELIRSIEKITGHIRMPAGICERQGHSYAVSGREPVTGRGKGEKRIRDEPGTRGLIGVYSPVHRIGKTRFAVRLGKKLAEKRSVLYLNLEGYSGEEHYFQNSTGYDLGDLIYCIKQERGDHGLKISSMACQTDGMDYIMPVRNEQDLRSVTKKEWISILDTICEKCIYETVILDLGDCIDGLYDILLRCSRIYTPYISETCAQAKLRQYEENLMFSGYGEILSKTIKKQMGKIRSQEEGKKGGA